MKTKCTVVIDNISSGNMKGEWGLSILVEYGDKKILVDVGGSELFAENMSKLGFDIAEIDYAVLSHAHCDHANGMERFFKDNQKAKFYLQDGTGEDCYFKKFFIHKYIGIPKNIMTKYADRIEIVSGDFELCGGVYLIPHKTANLGEIGKKEMMYRRTANGWKADDFSHEQSLVLDTEKGLIIVNSCSHGGAVNIIDEVAATFPGKHVYGLIGGFHLYKRSAKEIREIAKAIQEKGVDYICTGHCTKNRAYGIMKKVLGDKLHQLKVGLEMNF